MVGFVKKLKNEGDDAPSVSNCRLTAGEKRSHEAVKPSGRSNAALYSWF
jgi:hypothetical protein